MGKHRWFLFSDDKLSFYTKKCDSVQCETISLIKFQPSHGAVDFLGNLDAFRWENPDSCFYFKAANSLLKQKRPTSCKIKKQEKTRLKKS